MSGYNNYNQGYGQPTGGWQQNQNQQPYNPPHQHPTQGGYYSQPTPQYGSSNPQPYGNAPSGGYQNQPSYQSNQYSQPPVQQHNNYSQPSGPAPGPGQTGDRGMMGALAGGAAGGLLGKKNNHGFLGTVGGAIVGSLLEDAAKKKKHGHH